VSLQELSNSTYAVHALRFSIVIKICWSSGSNCFYMQQLA